MAKKLYRIEHTHEVTDVYLVEAESAEQAENLFLDDEVGDIVDSWELGDLGTFEILEASNADRDMYEAQGSDEDDDEDED